MSDKIDTMDIEADSTMEVIDWESIAYQWLLKRRRQYTVSEFQVSINRLLQFVSLPKHFFIFFNQIQVHIHYQIKLPTKYIAIIICT